MTNKRNDVQKRYDRISGIYDRFEQGFEQRYFSAWRKAAISNLTGDILEVGVGTGKNLVYYNDDAHVTGIDLSSGMLKHAKQKLEKIGSNNIKLKIMDVENLEFNAGTFDHVISTFVFCSVPNPIKGLKEIKRVLNPSGTFIAIEHVLSNNKFIALHSHLLNPITRTLFGFNINRKTVDNIRKAGLKIVHEKNLAFYDVFKKIISKK